MSDKTIDEIIESIEVVVIYRNGIGVVCYLSEEDFYKLDVPCKSCLVAPVCTMEGMYNFSKTENRESRLMVLKICDKALQYFKDKGCHILPRAWTTEFDNWKINWSADFNKF